MPFGVISSGIRGDEGTASVELVAVVPFLLVAVLAVAQVALAGQALWSAGVAARAGARAALVGGNAAAVGGGVGGTGGGGGGRARPPPLRAGARVEEAGEVTVRVVVPRLFPAMPEVLVGASAALGPADG